MTTTYHTPIPFGAPRTAAQLEAPLGQLDAAIASVIAAGSGASTTLTAQANAGQKNMVVANGANFPNGAVFWIGDPGGTHETGVIASGGGTGTLVATVNLANTYAIGKPVSISPIELVDARGSYANLGARVVDIETRIFDIRRYGAVAGAGNSQAAIQAAVDAAFAAGGGDVFVPRGSFTVGSSITLKANVTLVGQGEGSILNFTGTDAGNTGLVQFAGDHATVRALKLVDLRAFGANPIASAGVRIVDSDYARVERCWITGFKGGAITGRDVLTVEIHDNVIETIGDQLSLSGDGILIQPSAAIAKRVSITGNIVRVCGKHGINIAGNVTFGVTDANVVGNISTENGDTGIVMSFVAGGQAVGNDCIGNGVGKTLGAATGGQGLQVTNSTDVAVSGNTCTGNTETGIEVRDTSTRVTVANNICKGNTFAGIKLNGAGVTDVAVTGNSVSSGLNKGIELVNGPSDIVISGNSCILNATDGIGLAGTPAGARVSITGNDCSNNSQTTTATSAGISIGGAYTDVTVVGNVCRSNLAKIQLWGIRFFSGDRILIVGNQARGNTNQIATTPETGGSTNFLSANNLAT